MTIPDKKLEGFYWQQMYKLGCASRANGPIMDTSGPWFEPSPWPYITWDLNVQLCYWALNTSNHLDIAASLPNALKRYQPAFNQQCNSARMEKRCGLFGT